MLCCREKNRQRANTFAELSWISEPSLCGPTFEICSFKNASSTALEVLPPRHLSSQASSIATGDVMRYQRCCIPDQISAFEACILICILRQAGITSFQKPGALLGLEVRLDQAAQVFFVNPSSSCLPISLLPSKSGNTSQYVGPALQVFNRMGVPGLFSYLARKYPKVVEPVSLPPVEEDGERETPYNNLYIGELTDLSLCKRS